MGPLLRANPTTMTRPVHLLPKNHPSHPTVSRLPPLVVDFRRPSFPKSNSILSISNVHPSVSQSRRSLSNSISQHSLSASLSTSTSDSKRIIIQSTPRVTKLRAVDDMFERKRRDSYGSSLDLSLDISIIPSIPLIVPPSPFAAHLTQLDLGDLNFKGVEIEMERNKQAEEQLRREKNEILQGPVSSAPKMSRRASRVFIMEDAPMSSTSTLSIPVPLPQGHQTMRASSAGSSIELDNSSNIRSRRASRAFSIAPEVTTITEKPVHSLSTQRASRAYVAPPPTRSDLPPPTVFRLVPSSLGISKSTKRMSILPPPSRSSVRHPPPTRDSTAHHPRASTSLAIPISATASSAPKSKVDDLSSQLTIPQEFTFGTRSTASRDEARKKRNKEKEKVLEQSQKRETTSSWGMMSGQVSQVNKVLSCLFHDWILDFLDLTSLGGVIAVHWIEEWR